MRPEKAKLRPGRASLTAWRAKIRPGRASIRPRWSMGDGWTEGWMSGNSPLCPTGHWPFGATAQKGGSEGKKWITAFQLTMREKKNKRKLIFKKIEQ